MNYNEKDKVNYEVVIIQCVILEVNGLKKVYKSVVRSVVKKIVYNDRIIAIKLQSDPLIF